MFKKYLFVLTDKDFVLDENWQRTNYIFGRCLIDLIADDKYKLIIAEINHENTYAIISDFVAEAKKGLIGSDTWFDYYSFEDEYWPLRIQLNEFLSFTRQLKDEIVT